MPDAKLETLDRRISETRKQLTELEAFRAQYLKVFSDDEIAKANGKLRQVAAAKKASQRMNSHATAPNSTGLRDAMRVAELPSQFTIENVVQILKANNFDFDERKPEAAVRDSLYVLAKKQRGFRLVKKGRGGKPNLYEKIL